MSTLQISRSDVSNAAWDEFVESRSDSSFCHLSGWRPVMEDVLGHEWFPLAARDGDGTVCAVLPLVRVRSWIFGDYLISMPFLNYGGPVGETEACRALVGEAREIAGEMGVDLLELRTRNGVPDVPVPVNQRKITVVLDLPDDPDVLWEDVLRSKVRSQVRRPRKEGMVAHFGPEELDAFYRVFGRNMRDLGTPVLPRSFFRQILDSFPERVHFGAVYLDDLPVAAGCGFTWNDEFEMTWAASNYDYSRMAPNMLLYWSFMERMIQRGLGSFNFGRCTPDSGTHRFKSQWGEPRDEPLPWLQWSDSGVTEPPDPEAPLFKLATEVWSRLPLAMTNRLGPLIARSLP